jgi:hypothetical protein
LNNLLHFCMAIEEVAIICFSLITMVAVVCFAYFKSEERKESMRQAGITQRAVMKQGQPGENATSPTGEWWVPLATKLLEVPAVQNMIAEKMTTMIKKD